MEQVKVNLDDIDFLISESQRIGIFFHTYPDWDCLGCAFALRQLIFDNYSNKSVKVFGDRKGKLFFLKEGISTQKTISPEFIRKGSLAIVVDTWRKEKVECSELLKNFERVLVIDHHKPWDLSQMIRHDLYLRDTESISCAEVILKIAEHLNWRISSLTASFLYCGVMGDSQVFLNYNLKRDCFLACYKLMTLGADVRKINQNFNKKDLIHEKLKSQLIISGILKKGYFYTVVSKDLLTAYKTRFNTESKLFFLIHSINIRGANVVGVWFKYQGKLVIAIHTIYSEKEVKNLGFMPLRNNGSSYSFQKNFDGKNSTVEEELEKVIATLP